MQAFITSLRSSLTRTNLVLLFLGFLLTWSLIIVAIANGKGKQNQSSPAKIQSVTPTTTPSPTKSESENIKKQPTIVPARTSIPTSTPTATPSPTSIPTPTSKPKDTTPPTIHQMTGPEDGSTVTFNNFCFPVYATDNESTSSDLSIRWKFDSPDWQDWSKNFALCQQNVSNGTHTVSVQVKDKEGNESQVITKTFTVNAQ